MIIGVVTEYTFQKTTVPIKTTFECSDGSSFEIEDKMDIEHHAFGKVDFKTRIIIYPYI